ncbi:hypothetical protein SAMN05421505_120119 [Sinosporangium album]|uniref:Uncharacterized protein n=1 Tax=Sinosporangium album TaxID=504805 RepID=A0A1G8EIN7_9ACTN|nr:hypothetical protein [Sinosporangium album]SDH69778.1 hypothetical protein SAMN05421505_120119 [Sinosporangium album]
MTNPDVTADAIAEMLTRGDNDYNETHDGWPGMSATGNIVHITWTPVVETDTGGEADTDNIIYFEAHVIPAPPATPPAASEPVDLPADTARVLLSTLAAVIPAERTIAVDGWTPVADVDLAAGERQLVIRDQDGHHYATVYRPGTGTIPFQNTTTVSFDPVTRKTRVICVDEWTP